MVMLVMLVMMMMVMMMMMMMLVMTSVMMTMVLVVMVMKMMRTHLNSLVWCSEVGRFVQACIYLDVVNLHKNNPYGQTLCIFSTKC